MSESDRIALAELFDITEAELLFGPAYRPDLVTPAENFTADARLACEDASRGLARERDKLACVMLTDVLSAGRAGLRAGDMCVFDVSVDARERIEHDQACDGVVVLAEVRASGQPVMIVRQWIGPPPGLLITNRRGNNAVLGLAARRDIAILGTLHASLRAHR